jgi:Right handed beta helix region
VCLFSVCLGTSALASGSSVAIQAPIDGSTVSGAVPIALTLSGRVSTASLFIDGTLYASAAPSTVSWNSNIVIDGSHIISVKAFSNDGRFLGGQAVSVAVQNNSQPSPTATPTDTATPVPTQAPTSIPTVVPTPIGTPSTIPTRTATPVPTIVVTPTIAPTPTTTTTATATPVPTVVPTPTTAPTIAPTPTTTTTATATPVRTVVPTPTTAPTIAPTPTTTTTATATTGPTVAPTPTTVPTTVPTPTASASPSASPTPVGGRTYFVAPTGSDGNNGSSIGNAWTTVQHAANTMHSGDTAIVSQGTYNERVSITTDGVTIEADPNATATPVVAQGFDIGANNVTVNGFEITFQNNDRIDGIGIYIHDASNTTVENNNIHDLCHEGIYMQNTVSNIQVLNNKVAHAQMAGIMIDGDSDLIQGNEVSGTYQHPSVLGGIFAVCTNDGGSEADADYTRFFGSNHIIRSNYLHDIEWDYGDFSKPNPTPHTDCFQTWGSQYGEDTTNDLFDRNLCRGVTDATGAGDTLEVGATAGHVGTLTVQNNIFANIFHGLNLESTYTGTLNVYNNTFDTIGEEAIVANQSVGDNVENNIFYNVGGGGDGFIGYTNPVNFANNVFYTRSGAPETGLWWGGSAAPPYQAVDPKFINPGDPTGAGANYQLCLAGQNSCTATSPIGHDGMTIPSVTNDYQGTPRTSAYSVGAYQMH